MVIGIIGAGIAGLTAGRHLAKAGHEVTILEKSKGLGGRMATRYAGKDLSYKMDHGVSWFEARSPEFQSFTAELLEKKLVKLWGEKFLFFNGNNLASKNPYSETGAIYTSLNGMNSIGKYLNRWVDVKTGTTAGGLTHIGKNRSKKRTWMINLTTSGTFEADAVIIAAPAPQAYGLLNTTIDEINTLKIVSIIDEVNYRPAFSFMLGYGKDVDVPEWEGIQCRNSPIEFISNEATKRDNGQKCSLVIHTSDSFSRTHRDSDPEQISEILLKEVANITGGWASTPEWKELHFWRYSRPISIYNEPFLELEDEKSPLALIGDYFGGNDLDAAYRSGYHLAKHWIEKFGDQ